MARAPCCPTSDVAAARRPGAGSSSLRAGPPSTQLLALLAILASSAAYCAASAAVSEEADAQVPQVNEEPDSSDPTKALLEQLTIGMVSEVLDERTVEIRDSTTKHGRKRTLIRLGNTATPVKGAGPSEEQHQARLSAGKEALTKLTSKQMIWWQAAPDAHQPPLPEDPQAAAELVGDIWLIDGRHVNSLLVKQGHLDKAEVYESELARDILTAEADTQKKDAYKELEKALKESEKQKQKEAEEKLKEEQMKPEPFGISGWFAVVTVGVLFLAALFNFGRASPNKKGTGPGKKQRSRIGRLWMKLKGA